MQKNLKNRTTSFLAVSLALVLILSVALFSFLAIFLNKQSASTIREVSHMYMAGLSDQISRHFETIIGLRLDQLDVMMKDIDPEKIHYDPEQREMVIANAKAREFSYLGFYRTDDTFEMLYGSTLNVADPESFLASLSAGEKKVAIGTDQEGNDVILLGAPAVHSPRRRTPASPWSPPCPPPISPAPCLWRRMPTGSTPSSSERTEASSSAPAMPPGTATSTGCAACMNLWTGRTRSCILAPSPRLWRRGRGTPLRW